MSGLGSNLTSPTCNPRIRLMLRGSAWNHCCAYKAFCEEYVTHAARARSDLTATATARTPGRRNFRSGTDHDRGDRIDIDVILALLLGLTLRDPPRKEITCANDTTHFLIRDPFHISCLPHVFELRKGVHDHSAAFEKAAKHSLLHVQST
jgi:hypothetical protein